MKTYHVTTRENAIEILKEGLSPTCTRERKTLIPERECVIYAFHKFEDVQTWKAPGVILEVDTPEDALVGDFLKAGEAMNIKRCMKRTEEQLDPLDPSFWFSAMGQCSPEALEQALNEYKEGLIPLKEYKGQHKQPEILIKEPIPAKKVRIVGVKWQYVPTGTGIIKSGGSGPEYIEGVDSIEALNKRTKEHNEELIKDREILRQKMRLSLQKRSEAER